MWDSTLEHGGFPHSFRESPRRLTGAGPMITNDEEDLIGSYTHLNAGSTTLLAFPCHQPEVGTSKHDGINPAGRLDWTTLKV